MRHRVAIECKDWDKPVDQGQVLLFHQKIKNIGDEIVGVFVSRNGYQSGALEIAKRHGILALSDSDIPTIAQMLAKKIVSSMMPEDGCIGEPFWYIGALETKCDQPDGNYYAFPDDFPVKVPLFISRRHAEAFRLLLPDRDKLRVFGMPQYKLEWGHPRACNRCGNGDTDILLDHS